MTVYSITMKTNFLVYLNSYFDRSDPEFDGEDL